ncbi:hypothetical protein CBA19CS22_36840 [Caballeronia novacaledonica]|uniref:Uncharacterized protein n=1 Tax=Caballeronia novacaledonica TaxID=1544861 RepID=A0ACB5R5G0_9BURK|nr:hypothetical protein CBA19CS22_36840 [Caballeronia novacaledonica]
MALPRGTPKPQLAVFRDVLDSFPAGHFCPADLPMLARYADAAVQAAKLAKLLDEQGAIIEHPVSKRPLVNPAHAAYVGACNVMTSLASRLRICPSARIRQDAADLKPVPKAANVKRPWEKAK